MVCLCFVKCRRFSGREGFGGRCLMNGGFYREWFRKVGKIGLMGLVWLGLNMLRCY